MRIDRRARYRSDRDVDDGSPKARRGSREATKFMRKFTTGTYVCRREINIR